MNLSNLSERKSNNPIRPLRRAEEGYALIALVGIMMFALILTTMAAPMVQKESQREREEEMLWRGAQIARAILMYGPMGGPNGKPLTNLSELVEGREQPGAANGTKIARVRFLRPSALCDPMMPCKGGDSNWRLVRANDQLIQEFYQAILALQSKLPLSSPERGQLEIPLRALCPSHPVPCQQVAVKLGSDGQVSDSDSGPKIGPETRPILGVVSEKNGKMFRNYYGIEQYDHSLFYQGVPVRAGGFIIPAAFGQAVSSIPALPPRDQDGCTIIGGVRTGCIPKVCRDENGRGIPCPK